MKKLFTTIAFSLLIFANAQQINKKEGKWVFGGNLGLSFSNGTSILIQPEVGYRINNLEFGGVIGYNYTKFKGNNTILGSEYSLWNFGPYIQYIPFQNIFLRAQYQYYTGKNKYETTINGVDEYNFDESALFVGGGYQQQLANNTFLRVGFLYNVLYDEDTSFLGNAFVPFGGISVGF